jgi:hypothetical protein
VFPRASGIVWAACGAVRRLKGRAKGEEGAALLYLFSAFYLKKEFSGYICIFSVTIMEYLRLQSL